ncbi:LacI family DNA-binding transcriptional regulator [Vibrio sp. SA48]|uniref:LacI family DNA-binding transcriptional regulator n=1 Tax=Vibrio sp. S12_S33 TaxID=2720223 RepID=UPI00178425B9|nr:LacI family DNA-binding transcriptional regulator [Vibrio sp. S12_S33]MBD1567292.1 LacI family transcriptional regulator [Vibrio sp. S12_S33]
MAGKVFKNQANSTIVDIAKRANVTNITVSRAFNKPDLVKPETRKIILEIAKELNYIPNVFAQNLKNNQSKIIGFVSDSTFNPVYGVILKRLCKMADERGYIVMIFETGGSKSAERRAVQTLFGHKASAILLSVVSDRDGYHPDYLDLAQHYNIPLVLFDRDIPGSNLPGVFLNNIEIGVRAGKYLFKKDYPSYLIFAGPKDSDISLDRISGLLGGLRLTDKTIDIIHTAYTLDDSYPLVLDYLKGLETLPDCIIGINGLISLSVIKALATLNIEEVSLFSIDAVPYADIFDRNVPCIDNHPSEWGEKVGQLVFNILDNKCLPNERVYIHSTLKE